MRVTGLIAFVALAFGMMIATAAAQGSPKEQTIQNLQAAYAEESNAFAHYKACAEKADAASLFRAAARSEQIHAANHARVLNSLGVEAKAQPKQPEARSTQDNLKEAIKDESYERDTMYPEFIKVAREAKLPDAVKTFNQAKTAEAEHAKLFAAMLDKVQSGQKEMKGKYYVCPVCGFTAQSIDKKCPSCFEVKEKCEVID